jgi:hypothetical protein
MKKRSQSAIEFVILIILVLFLFASFSIVIQETRSSKLIEEKNNLFKHTALAIQDEINLASQLTDGYSREFIIPDKISNEEYNATITESMIYLQSSNKRYALALPVPKINGQIVKGSNIIKKQNGELYLN